MFINNKLNTNIHYFKLYELKQNDYDHFVITLSLLFKKKINLKIIFDLSSLTVKDFLYSKQFINFMKQNKNLTEKYIERTSIIIPNEFIRKNINFLIFNIYKPIKPNEITDTLENALNFLNK